MSFQTLLNWFVGRVAEESRLKKLTVLVLTSTISEPIWGKEKDTFFFSSVDLISVTRGFCAHLY